MKPSEVTKPIEVTYYDTDIAIVSLFGEHDLSTSRDLEQLFGSLLRSGEQLIVDLTQAEFIDSSVLNNLVRATKRAEERGLTVTLQVATAPAVRRVLEVTGLLSRFPIAATREEAILLARDGTGSNGKQPG